MYWGGNGILVHPQDLQRFAWSAPMRDLAAKVGLSDVGLKKVLRSHGITVPPRGHWNRVAAGQAVPACPKVGARGPGGTGRIGLDSRFEGVISATPAIPSTGPFASPAVPEDLEELYALELKAIGRVTVPRDPDREHAGLIPIRRKEERRRAKFLATGWTGEAPKFEGALDRRRLRILNALFLALARRGHSPAACEQDGEIQATVTVGNTCVVVDIALASEFPSAAGRSRTELRTEADDARLAVRIGPDRKAPAEWRDDESGKLETKLAEIAARIIVAGEAAFRKGRKLAEEQVEQWRRRDEERQREAVAKVNAERLAHLRKSGELLRQAEDLRALIAHVLEAVDAGAVAVDASTLKSWHGWASEEADRLDPVLSGQIMTHLKGRDS